MSVESLAKALNVANVTAAERLVLVGIANHDGDGGAWPSIATLARYACCSPRHVQRTLSSLVARGFVTIEGQAGGTADTRSDRRPNRYTLHLSTPLVEKPSHGVTPRSPGPERGDTQVANGVTPRSPEPSLEPSFITSSDNFTVEALVRKAEQLRKEHPIHRQRIIKRDQAERLTALTPQPPIDLCAYALLGEEQSLRIWNAEHPLPTFDPLEDRPASGAEGLRIAREAAKAEKATA